jgi:ABC-2 type transport system ATP-binding protein
MKDLDPEWRLRFKHFLEKYVKKEKAAALFSTHILSDVDEICEKLTVIKDGRVLFPGSLEELKKHFSFEESVLIKVQEVRKALELLKQFGYSPKLTNNFILLKNAEPPEINKLLVKNGITVEEIKKKGLTLETLYSTLYGRHKH